MFEAFDRSFNKLARTFAGKMEALKRYRSKGEQKVTVEHLALNEGGRLSSATSLMGQGLMKKCTITPCTRPMPLLAAPRRASEAACVVQHRQRRENAPAAYTVPSREHQG
jgi:hypothetical protein